MGTHPIFESDFDCLTVVINITKNEKTHNEKRGRRHRLDEVGQTCRPRKRPQHGLPRLRANQKATRPPGKGSQQQSGQETTNTQRRRCQARSRSTAKEHDDDGCRGEGGRASVEKGAEKAEAGGLRVVSLKTTRTT